MLSVTYIEHMGSDLRTVQAARASFGATTDTLRPRDTKLISYLAEHRHMGPFEHNSLTVSITCPVYIARQIMRHRTFSYSEISRRYTGKNIELYQPEVYRKQSLDNKQASEGVHTASDYWKIRVELHQQKALELYSDMVEEGVAKEQARGVLPQNLLTTFYMTGNLRNWAHFIDLRRHKDAQYEVTLLADAVYDILKARFPVCTEALLNNPLTA